MMKGVFVAGFAVASVSACPSDAITKCAADNQVDPKKMEDICPTSQKLLTCIMTADPTCKDACTATKTGMEQLFTSCKELNCDPPPACFPGLATVELSSGKMIQMDQLKVGDKVRVSATEFSEVYYFSTSMAAAETTSKFIKVVAGNATLQLTPGHYLYVNGALTTAEKVQVGDMVVLASGEKASITEVGSSWAGGLYNPHTLHGDVVVNGVLTSTYTEAVHPTLAHALLSPLRAMYAAGTPFGSTFSTLTKGLPKWVLNAIQA